LKAIEHGRATRTRRVVEAFEPSPFVPRTPGGNHSGSDSECGSHIDKRFATIKLKQGSGTFESERLQVAFRQQRLKFAAVVIGQCQVVFFHGSILPDFLVKTIVFT
jgi:hypothetical protein